jgi:undecaprenyl pyrophosphate synthase
MTNYEIIHMARQVLSKDIDGLWLAGTPDLEAFAKLVVQHERDRIISANELVIEHVNEHIKQLHYAVQAEREVILDMVAFYGGSVDLVDAIRARGETTSRGEAQ